MGWEEVNNILFYYLFIYLPVVMWDFWRRNNAIFLSFLVFVMYM